MNTPKSPRLGGVQSLERAFELLDLMAHHGGETSLSQLATASGLPLPTIHRIVRTMVAQGYARQLPSRRYALGPHLIRLGEVATRMLSAWAHPQLSWLVDEIGETANMAMLDWHKAVYVAQVPSQHSLRKFTEVGRRVLLHCTGVGKVLLAQVSPAIVQEVVSDLGMPAFTPHTITDLESLTAELELIRGRGYAVDNEEKELGVRCVAVPVLGVPGALTAISISGPGGRLTVEAVERVVPVLQQAARELARQFEADNPDEVRTVSGSRR